MNPTTPPPPEEDATAKRAAALFEENQQRVWQRTDRMFIALMLFQWLACIGIAVWLSPHTWSGSNSSIHPHVWAAIFFGGAVTSLPVLLARLRPGRASTRHVVAVGQMLMSALLIHVTGGRIETHFHVFGSLAFLAFYRDWRLLVVAAAVTAADHLLRGYYSPQTIFGIANAGPWRWLEHAGWVVFEVVFLWMSIRHSLRDAANDALRTAELDALRQNFADQVTERTAALTTEIAERKQAEERLRLRDSALRAAANAIAIVDRHGEMIWINPAFTDLTGYNPWEAVGQNARILRSGKHGREFYARMWKTILTGEIWHGELLNRRKDGSLYSEEMTITPIRDAAGEITHFIAIKQDITDRKRVETDLAAARDSALAAVRSKSQFLANMSHEIRTPMNGVMGMTGLLLDTALDREQRDYVETIRQSGDLLLTIINDILDFSKIDAGKLVFETLDFDLREVVEGTLELLAEQTQAKGLELLGEVEVDVFTHLRGDPGRLRQILTNLLNNAIKFTESGEVLIRVAQTSATDREVVLRFEVRDTGIGISAEAQQSLFQPFSQADGSTTRRYGGTGLGLAISRQLVGLMHGEIGVESTPGQGSTFWFTARLPKQPVVPVPRDTETLGGLRVLIVDDNATNRQILQAQLASLRMKCLATGNGLEALAALRSNARGGTPFDLAILDMQMPEMDGLMLAESIKADPTIAGIPLIMLSSLGHNMSSERVKEAGIEEYLIKPAKQSRLYDCIATVMARGQQAQPAPVDAEPAEPIAEVARSPLRILLAEDNRINQKVALQQLKKLGFQADTAADGNEVLTALRQIPYDLILMDCQMPEMDGYEATARIRQEHPKPVYIIAMTAHAMQGDREKCLAAGMDDYLTKPVRTDDLRVALDRWRSAVEKNEDAESLELAEAVG